MTLKEKLKLFIPEENTDSLLDLLLERAKNAICNYCNIVTVPEEIEDLQIDIAVRYYNRLGQEGSSSYSEGGKSQTFEEVLSADVRRQLYRHRVIT